MRRPWVDLTLRIGAIATAVALALSFVFVREAPPGSAVVSIGAFVLLCVLGMSALLIACLFFRKFVWFWLIIAPLYYFPFVFMPRGAAGSDGPLFWFHAGKDAIVLAIVIVWLIRVVARGSIPCGRTRLVVGVMASMAFGVVRSIGLPLEGAQVVLRTYVEFPIFALLVLEVVRDADDASRLLRGWVLGSILVSVVGVGEYLFGSQGTSFSIAAGQMRVSSTMYNPNALGWYLAWIGSLILGMFPTFASKRQRATLLLALALGVLVIMLTGSRSSLVALFCVAILAPTLNASRRRSYMPLLLSGVCVGVVAALWGGSAVGGSGLRVLQVAGSWKLRVDRLLEVVPLVLTKPAEALIGVGFKPSTGVDPGYVNVLLSGGLVGLLIVAGTLFGYGAFAWRLHRSNVPNAYPLLLGLLCIMALAAIGSVFRIFPLAMLLWASCGVLARLEPMRVRAAKADL